MKILYYNRIGYMPKKVLNNMKGGDKVYNYNANKEWITGSDKLGNIDFLNKFERGGRPLSNRKANALEALLDLNNINGSVDEGMYMLNANKKEIDTAIRTLKNSEPLIEKLGSLKSKLNAEIRAIKSKDITSLDPIEVTDDIKRGIPLVGRLITNKAITTKPAPDLSNPTNAANAIVKFAREMEKGKSGRPAERDDAIAQNWGRLRLDESNEVVKRREIKEGLDKEGEGIVKFNIESMMGWRHIDLAKWPIGSLNDYIKFVWILLKKQDDNHHINDTLKWDSPDGVWILDWFTKIAGKFYTGGGGEEGLKEYIKSKIDINHLFKSKGIVGKSKVELKNHFFSISDNNEKNVVTNFENESWKNFVEKINKYIETKSNTKLKNRKEYLVVLLHWLFTYSISILNEFKATLKGNGLSDANMKAFDASIKAVDLLWKNGLQKFFKIKVVAKKYGIIDHGTKEGKYNPVEKNWKWRVIGGDNSIFADTKFNRTTYPIVVKTTGPDEKDNTFDEKETKERLTKILLGAEKDYHSNELITVGGILPKEEIAKVTLFVVEMYMNESLKIKKKNIKTINKMMLKMKQNIHIRFLIDTKNRLRRLYQRIADEYMENMKKRVATTTIDEIIDAYNHLKEKEREKIVAIYGMLALIEKDKIELRRNFDAIDKLQVQRERLLIDINQAQLKAMAFKLIALNLYKKMQIEVRSDFDTKAFRDAKAEAELMMTKVAKDRLPEKYFDLLSDHFEKVDQKYNSNIKEFIKEKKEFKGIRSQMIIDALSNQKNYHSEFWNNIFSNKNMNNIIEDNKNNNNKNNENNENNEDILFNNVNKNNTRKSSKKDTILNNKIKLSNKLFTPEMDNSHLSNKEKNIVKQQFWLNVRNKLGGRTIYMPFIKTRTILSDKYGFFDLLEACIRGRIDKELLILEDELTIPVLSKAIRPRGSVIVCGTEDNKDRPTRWRVMLKEELSFFSKMNESDLRIHFYKTLSDETIYNKRSSLHWYYDNKLFKNILKYCRSLKSYQDCPLITSREEISKKLNVVDGIQFGGRKRNSCKKSKK